MGIKLDWVLTIALAAILAQLVMNFIKKQVGNNNSTVQTVNPAVVNPTTPEGFVKMHYPNVITVGG